MISIYKTDIKNNELLKLETIEQDSWINLVAPTQEEIDEVVTATGIERELIVTILDEEELPRIEVTDNSTLIVMDFPYTENKKQKNKFSTMPVGIFITNNNIVTVSLKKCEVFYDLIGGKVKGFYTQKKTRFVIQLSHKISMLYLKYLKSIDKEIEEKEEIMSKSTGNEELISLLNTEKSLVYFITALKSNGFILEKLAKGNTIKLFEEDAELLDDAIIENNQGKETANIYREILSNISETYATIISNNLNVVMKFLASITIVFSIPTIVFAFFGMNVPFGWFELSPIAAISIGIFSIAISLLTALFLRKKDLL
jgi:magnesium transporter